MNRGNTRRLQPARLVAVREERFQELVGAEVAYLATVPVKPVSMRQARSISEDLNMVRGCQGLRHL